MKYLRLIMPAAALLGLLFSTSSLTFATKEMSKKEKKPCTTCHPKGNNKELNDVGKYYKEKKSLDGAPAPAK
jgi:hypothetical protein